MLPSVKRGEKSSFLGCRLSLVWASRLSFSFLLVVLHAMTDVVLRDLPTETKPSLQIRNVFQIPKSVPWKEPTNSSVALSIVPAIQKINVQKSVGEAIEATGDRRGNFAYAYIVAGCEPTKSTYRYYLYDILVSARIQRLAGSQADFYVFVQMAFDQALDELPNEDVRLLEAMNIRFEYLQKTPDESFYRTMLDKFKVLSLEQYDRVLFMDSDVMAKANLDYLFDLSMQGLLKDSLVIAGKHEPASGGFFMVAPRAGDWERILQVIREKEERGRNLPYPHFDNVTGWGQPFVDGDFFELPNGYRSNQWNFYGAFADQGLLYHWVKYEQKSVSVILRNSIHHWSAGDDGKVQLEKMEGIRILQDHTPKHPACKSGGNLKECYSPHCDFVHFTGLKKPWLDGPPRDYPTDSWSDTDQQTWFFHLQKLNVDFQMNLNFTNWTEKPKRKRRPLLGYYPLNADVAKANYALSA